MPSVAADTVSLDQQLDGDPSLLHHWYRIGRPIYDKLFQERHTLLLQVWEEVGNSSLWQRD